MSGSFLSIATYRCRYACIALLVAVAPCMASPTIFSVSDPIEPDETAIVAGDGLEHIKKVVITRVKNDLQTTDSAAERQEATLIQPTHASLKFTVPKGIGPGVYRFELVGDDGAAGGYLNAPKVYWLQGNRGPEATAGGWVRRSGRDIVRSSDAVLTMLPENEASKPINLRPAAAGLWDATFALPSNIAIGTYRVRLWNGQGDGGAVSEAGVISIVLPATDRGPSVDVDEFGAKGDGRADDLDPIRAALAQAAKNGGGTVYFRRGRYFLSGALEIPPNVTLKGEARDLVSLNWPQFDKAARH